MAGKLRKSGVEGWKASKRKKQKYMILFVGAVMVLSGLYLGLGREMPEAEVENPRSQWNVVEYDSSQLSSASAVARVVGVTDNLKLIPKNMGLLGEDDVTGVFESNITGVRNITLETSKGYSMFRFETEGGNITGEIKRRISLPGGYRLYGVYRASTQAGELNIVGEDLKVGDYVKVLLLQRTRKSISEVLGFVQNTVGEGPVVGARVVGFESLSFMGLSPVKVFEEDVTAALNASDLTVDESLINASTNESVWVVSFSMPVKSDVAYARERLSMLNVSNVTVGWYGYSETPEEMVLDWKAVKIPNYESLPTTFNYNTKVNDTVRVKVILMKLGNQTIAFASEFSGNGTAAQ